MPDIDTPKTPDDKRVAYLALLACTVGVGAVTFALSFVGLRDYGERVVRLDPSLSWLVPVGVDGLTLCAVAATMIVRHGRWHVRLYTWTAFGVAVAASVAGNVSHAQALGLSWQGHVGAGAWPVFLALSSHLVIVVRRHMERANERRTGHATDQPTPVGAEALPATSPPAAEPTPPRRRVPRKAANRDNDLTRQRARDAYRRGETQTAIAAKLGVSHRTVQRYTAGVRPPKPTAAADTTATEPEREAVASWA